MAMQAFRRSSAAGIRELGNPEPIDYPPMREKSQARPQIKPAPLLSPKIHSSLTMPENFKNAIRNLVIEVEFCKHHEA
jgi:hypothetical protein